MINLNELGWLTWQALFFSTPYKTGNLARNGIGDLRTTGPDSVGFSLFDQPTGSVGKGTEYGRILNEAPVINYRVTNPYTKKVYTGSYVNKHYRWVDKFAEQWANEITLYGPIRRA